MSDYEQKRDQLLQQIYENTIGACVLDAEPDRQQHEAGVDALVQQAQNDGVAWAISIIDELHIGTPGSDTTDRLMKGIKNDIRSRYEAATGIDPAPDYPVKVELRKPGEVGE